MVCPRFSSAQTPPPPSPPTFVQENYSSPQTPQTKVSVAYRGAQTAGDANLLAIGWHNTTAGITSVTDTAGNNYQVALPVFRGSRLSQAIYYAANIKGGPNIVTVNFNQPAVYVDLRATEYSGLPPTNIFDAGISGTGVGGFAESGSLRPTAANELLFGAGITENVFTSAGSGFTLRVITSPDADIIEDEIAGTANPYNATANLASGAWLMQLAAFKSALAAAPGLRISLTATNTVVIAWSSTATGYRLQETASLTAPNWLGVTNAAGVVSNEFQTILPRSFTQRYFRLINP